MRLRSMFMFMALAAALGLPSFTRAASLTDGALSITVSDSIGTFDSVTFGGSEFYNLGAPVANYGFQLNGDVGTFRGQGIA